MEPSVVSARPDLARPQASVVDGVIDLRDVTTAVFETCSALALSLREGDLFAARRLFGFLVDQIPDRRSVVTDVFHPLVVAEIRSGTASTAAIFTRTCHELLEALRRPPTPVDGAALLVAAAEGLDALSMQMVALLLDDVGIPSTVIVDSDAAALQRFAGSGGAAVACLAAGGDMTREDEDRLALALRPLRTVVLAGTVDAACDVAVDERVATMGEVVDALLRLRGPLTAAEVAALRLAADGYTNVRIARELGVSVSAIKARLEGGYSKLHAQDRTHAVAIALRQRWIR
jgi:DNA-binding NarL/FixJ family response regulator